MMAAVSNSGLGLVRALLAGKASIGTSAVSGDSPLSIAAGAGRADTVRELLQAKASTGHTLRKVCATNFLMRSSGFVSNLVCCHCAAATATAVLLSPLLPPPPPSSP